MISLDIELVKKMRDAGINVSRLANELLNKHMNDEGWKSLSPEELEREIKRVELKEEYEKRLKEVDDGA